MLSRTGGRVFERPCYFLGGPRRHKVTESTMPPKISMVCESLARVAAGSGLSCSKVSVKANKRSRRNQGVPSCTHTVMNAHRARRAEADIEFLPQAGHETAGEERVPPPTLGVLAPTVPWAALCRPRGSMLTISTVCDYQFDTRFKVILSVPIY